MSIFYIPHFADFEWQRPVIGFSSIPPSSPMKGDRYIISKHATGAWSGHDDEITFWTSTPLDPVFKWHFFSPKNGMLIYVDTEDRYYKYTKGSWKKTNIN